VNGLYTDFAMQCGTCGLRFNDKEKMAKHLDWHFMNNQREKQKTKKAVSRTWFATSEEWALGIDVAEKPAMPFFAEPAAEEPQEEDVANVVADESQTHCGVCGEKFDQFWDNDLEDWMYRAAVKVEGTGQIFHQKCYSHQNQGTAPDGSVLASGSTPATDNATATASSCSNPTPTLTDGSSPFSSLSCVKKEPEEGTGEGGTPGENRDDTTPEDSGASIAP